eukprot:SAG11_NODE_11469_length_758_cov_17.094082_1_plen_116_part_10
MIGKHGSYALDRTGGRINTRIDPSTVPQAFMKDRHMGKPYCVFCKVTGHTASRSEKLRRVYEERKSNPRASNYALGVQSIRKPSTTSVGMAPMSTRSTHQEIDPTKGVDIDPNETD